MMSMANCIMTPIEPKSALGKRLNAVGIHLRNKSNASGLVTKTMVIGDSKDTSHIRCVWKVTERGVVSLRANYINLDKSIEFLYGQLTISYRNKGRTVYPPLNMGVAELTRLIARSFPGLSNKIQLDQRIRIN